jgi:23S rRNA (uracil1939-C5)-methyltransferase
MLVDIERILPGGVGLAHADGKTIFVSLAASGDRVRVRIDREQGNLVFASVAEIIEGGPDRIEPPCPYFGRCGGCDFQQLTYQAQLNAKAGIINDCLQRIAKLDTPAVDVVPSPNPWRYRARAVWQLDPEFRTVGYYERGSRRVCDVADCAVLVPELQTTLEKVRTSERPTELKHLEVVSGHNGVSLAPAFGTFQTEELTLTVAGELYRYNADAFFQINQELLPQLLQYALAHAAGETALDLYSGVGLFAVPLGRRFVRVVAVESNATATRFAKRNIESAGLDNVNVVTATVSDWIRSTTHRTKRVDFVLLDPPRAGAESAVIKGIVDLQPSKICYVSCDPATLARDLKKLVAGGFNIQSLRGFDMFPQTHHVETVVHLEISDPRSQIPD